MESRKRPYEGDLEASTKRIKSALNAAEPEVIAPIVPDVSMQDVAMFPLPDSEESETISCENPSLTKVFCTTYRDDNPALMYGEKPLNCVNPLVTARSGERPKCSSFYRCAL